MKVNKIYKIIMLIFMCKLLLPERVLYGLTPHQKDLMALSTLMLSGIAAMGVAGGKLTILDKLIELDNQKKRITDDENSMQKNYRELLSQERRLHDVIEELENKISELELDQYKSNRAEHENQLNYYKKGLKEAQDAFKAVKLQEEEFSKKFENVSKLNKLFAAEELKLESESFAKLFKRGVTAAGSACVTGLRNVLGKWYEWGKTKAQEIGESAKKILPESSESKLLRLQLTLEQARAQAQNEINNIMQRINLYEYNKKDIQGLLTKDERLASTLTGSSKQDVQQAINNYKIQIEKINKNINDLKLEKTHIEDEIQAIENRLKGVNESLEFKKRPPVWIFD